MTLLSEAKKLARDYYALTGKPLGVTGEVAEYEAARILGVELTPARQAGYDAIERRNGSEKRLQIKGRCLQENCKPGQRLGSIRQDHDWDSVLMVLLDHNFDALEIYEAQRPEVVAALTVPGSKARNERGALSVSKFKSIGTLRWRRKAADSHTTKDHRDDTQPEGSNVPSQRDMMREIYRRFRGDEAAIIREYAAAEVRGDVSRGSNEYDVSPEEYASRLLADARKKGWIAGFKG